MNKYLLEKACELAFKNKSYLTSLNSCYYCLNTILKEDIAEWTDNYQTAICPICHIDSVIPFEVDLELLKQIHIKWFSETLD